MSDKTRILVVEDETPIRRGLCDVLAFHGYAPTAAEDGTKGLELARSGDFALVVLDVMMPGLDGFTVCERLRAENLGVAVLMLTAKGAEEDVVRGFEAGADDYVTKPFSIVQLMARVKALLRRVRSPERFALGPFEVDVDRLAVRRGDVLAELTKRDVELLAHLAQARGRIIDRAELLTEVWGYTRADAVETRCVDVHIAKLRKKLAAIGAEALIQTVRGAGDRVD